MDRIDQLNVTVAIKRSSRNWLQLAPAQVPDIYESIGACSAQMAIPSIALTVSAALEASSTFSHFSAEVLGREG
eukprot:6204775-Pleurochrysis_carterae.AAC.4